MKIYVESSSLHYYRYYQNIITILANSLPIISLIHNIFKLIAKTFKSSSVNKKMTELLFENLTEKPNKYENYKEELNSKTLGHKKIKINNAMYKNDRITV